MVSSFNGSFFLFASHGPHSSHWPIQPSGCISSSPVPASFGQISFPDVVPDHLVRHFIERLGAPQRLAFAATDRCRHIDLAALDRTTMQCYFAALRYSSCFPA